MLTMRRTSTAVSSVGRSRTRCRGPAGLLLHRPARWTRRRGHGASRGRVDRRLEHLHRGRRRRRETVRFVEEAGGTVSSPPQDAGPAGRWAEIVDPTGGRVRLWKAGRRLGSQVVNLPGAWNFSDLHTADPPAARAFYDPLFGWEADELGGGSAHVASPRLRPSTWRRRSTPTSSNVSEASRPHPGSRTQSRGSHRRQTASRRTGTSRSPWPTATTRSPPPSGSERRSCRARRTRSGRSRPWSPIARARRSRSANSLELPTSRSAPASARPTG